MALQQREELFTTILTTTIGDLMFPAIVQILPKSIQVVEQGLRVTATTEKLRLHQKDRAVITGLALRLVTEVLHHQEVVVHP